MDTKVKKTDDEWKKALSPQQFEVTRRKGTEPAFTGVYWDHHGKGTYRCVCCGAELFSSLHKYDSRSGWPSYFQPLRPENVATEEDRSHGMVRVEVRSRFADSHLGHLFPDGPLPNALDKGLGDLIIDVGF